VAGEFASEIAPPKRDGMKREAQEIRALNWKAKK
jgi:hypothetical protein